ncbi:MAG: uracil-DNA glycosylase [Nitrospirae bacterium]|nr:uracil-DNA glycosylase [Nitrospirota bacterium]
MAESVRALRDYFAYLGRSGVLFPIPGAPPPASAKAATILATSPGDPAPAPPAPQATADTLEKIRDDLGDCTRCRLHQTRRNIVFGVGNPKARIVFVGEAPGADEDAKGEPFVGRAGQLLTNMLKAFGLNRSDVYICNVLKCRPPENRDPDPVEAQTCSPFMLRQIRAIRPKVVCALGKHAAHTLLRTTDPITKLRGKAFDFEGTKLVPAFHPAYLLRNPRSQWEARTDLKKVLELAGNGGKP